MRVATLLIMLPKEAKNMSRVIGFRNDLEHRNVVMMKMHAMRDKTEHVRSTTLKVLYCSSVSSEANIVTAPRL